MRFLGRFCLQIFLSNFFSWKCCESLSRWIYFRLFWESLGLGNECFLGLVFVECFDFVSLKWMCRSFVLIECSYLYFLYYWLQKFTKLLCGQNNLNFMTLKLIYLICFKLSIILYSIIINTIDYLSEASYSQFIASKRFNFIGQAPVDFASITAFNIVKIQLFLCQINHS